MRTGYEAKQSLPQCKMGLDAQEQLAKSYKARNVQDGGGCEVVKLESVELQEPPEKRVYGTRGRGPLLGVEAKERNIYKEARHYSTGA